MPKSLHTVNNKTICYENNNSFVLQQHYLWLFRGFWGKNEAAIRIDQNLAKTPKANIVEPKDRQTHTQADRWMND